VNMLRNAQGRGDLLKGVSDPGLLGSVEKLHSRGVEMPFVSIDDSDEARKLLIAIMSKDTVSMHDVS
jgi:hypothetical protein